MTKKLFIDINKFSLPLIFSHILNLIIGQFAFSIAAKLGTNNLIGIHTIDNLIYSVSGMLGVISVAFSMLSSKALGEKKQAKFNNLVSSIMLLNILIGVIFFVIIVLFSTVFIKYIYGFSGDLLTISKTYLYSMSFYVLLTLITFTLTNLLKIEKKTTNILYISVAISLVQLMLNYVFINGIWFIPKMGVFGAGLSMNISLLITVISYSVLVRKNLVICLRLKPIYLKQILIKSAPLACQEFLESIIFLIYFDAMVSRMNGTSLGGNSIISQALMYLKMPMFMYGSAVTIFASEFYGKKMLNKIKEVKKITTTMSIILYCCIAVLIYLLKIDFISIFTADDDLLAFTSDTILIIMILVFPIIFYEMNKYVLQVMDKGNQVVKYTIIINFISMFIIFFLYKRELLSLVNIYIVMSVNYTVLSIVFNKIFKQIHL